MANLFARPNLDEMRQRADQLIGGWSLDGAQQAEEDLYFQRFPVRAPANHLAIRTGSAPSDADAAIDSIFPRDIQVRVRPARNMQKYQDQAAKLARFGQALLASWRGTETDPLGLCAADQVIRRVGVVRLLIDDSVWDPRPPAYALPDPDEAEFEDPQTFDERIGWEIKHRSKNPLVCEARNPRFVRWLKSQDELLMVVEYYQTTALEAANEYGRYPAARAIIRGHQPHDKLRVKDCWYGAHRCIFLEEQPILPYGRGEFKGVVPHGLKEIPYAIAAFRELNFEEVALRYRGLLTNAASLYPAESNVLSMHMSMLAWNAWRTFVGWTIDGRPLEVEPGKMITIRRHMNEYLEMMRGDPVPPELLQSAGVMDQYIQRNGVAQGPRTQEGTRSAQQIWAIQSIRQMKIDLAKTNMQKLVKKLLRMSLQMVQYNLREPLTLPVPGLDREGKWQGEVTIGPDDIDEYFDGWEISFGRRLDPAVIQQASSVMGMALNKWMPMRTSYELSGLTDNPSEWEELLLRETVEHMPALMEAAALKQAKNYYGEDDDIYQALLAQQQQGGMGGAAPGQPQGGTMQPGGMPRGTAPSLLDVLAPAGGSAPAGPSGGNGSVGGSRPPGTGGGGMPGEGGGF